MAVSYDQALNFYKKNRDKFPGMTATQAADQIVRGGEIPLRLLKLRPLPLLLPPLLPLHQHQLQFQWLHQSLWLRLRLYLKLRLRLFTLAPIRLRLLRLTGLTQRPRLP